jgi:hypothetical protein
VFFALEVDRRYVHILGTTSHPTGVPAGAGVGQVDRDLGVLDPSGGAGVLALHPDRPVALLQVACLVEHQHRIRITELPDDVVAQVLAHPVGVPPGPGEQVLHAVRIAVARVLGDRPAVLARQIGQQPEQEPADPAAGLHPPKPGGHPIEQPVGLRVPPPGIYSVAHGHRLIFRCRHNGRGSRGGRATSGTATPQDHDLRLE